MKNFFSKSLIGAAVALSFSGSVFAQVNLNNGSVIANLGVDGNFDPSASPGLSYNGTEYINQGTFASWYWLTTTSPIGSFLAYQDSLYVTSIGSTNVSSLPGTQTTSAPSIPAGEAGTTIFMGGAGGLKVTMNHLLTTANQMSTTINITNTVGGSGTISGIKWNVGLDPDQDVAGWGSFFTNNVITGVGGNAAVTAYSNNGVAPITLANSTGAGAYSVKAFINTGDCCNPVDGATALSGGQILGFAHNSDSSISLGYDLGSLADGASVSFGYTYTFAAPVPEPETYAMLLAGLGLMGFMARRRKQRGAAV